MSGRPVPRYRTKVFWALLIPLLCALSAFVVWFVYIRPTPVQVTLHDGRIVVDPAALKGIQGSVRFLVENQGAQPHQFILVAIDKPAGQIPVKDGVAQFFSDTDDMNDYTTWTTVIYDGFQNGGYAMPGPQENPPLGPPMQPGEKREVGYGIPGMKIGPETLTILCNLPGHYEQGEYEMLTINK